MNSRSGSIPSSKACICDLVPVEVGLHALLVHLAQDRAHDEDAQEQRQAGEHLVGRDLLETQGVRVSPSTTRILVKLVQVSRIAGASESSVSPSSARIGVLGFLVRRRA